jgi:hypothetical protein
MWTLNAPCERTCRLALPQQRPDRSCSSICHSAGMSVASNGDFCNMVYVKNRVFLGWQLKQMAHCFRAGELSATMCFPERQGGSCTGTRTLLSTSTQSGTPCLLVYVGHSRTVYYFNKNYRYNKWHNIITVSAR